MAKEKSSTDPTKDKKKEKKEKRRSEENGISKPSKKEKKDKDKKRTLENSVAVADTNEEVAGKENAPGDGEMKDAKEKVKEEDEEGKKKLVIVGAIVPFANPLCDEKVTKKVLRGVKKGKCFLSRIV
jgi:H/ACA ribonucleoprotein complex subunit 2